MSEYLLIREGRVEARAEAHCGECIFTLRNTEWPGCSVAVPISEVDRLGHCIDDRPEQMLEKGLPKEYVDDWVAWGDMRPQLEAYLDQEPD